MNYRILWLLGISLLFSSTVLFAQESPEINLKLISNYQSGIFDEGAAEIIAYDSPSRQLFVINSNDGVIDIVDYSDPFLPVKTGSIDVSSDVSISVSGVNSVDVFDGLVAVAVEADPSVDNGVVAFYDTDGNFQFEVPAGALPDAVKFSPDGTTVVVANEGEPADDYSVDPEGSVTIIDVGTQSAQQVNFNGFDSQKETLLAEGVRIFGGATPFEVIAFFGIDDNNPDSVAVADVTGIVTGDWITIDSDNTDDDTDAARPYQVASIDGNTLILTTEFDVDLNDDGTFDEGTDITADPSFWTLYKAGNATVSQDLEPESLTFGSDGVTAWVTLQENNAVAIVDIASGTVTDIVALGTKDHSTLQNGLDVSNDDDAINIANWPVKGFYMPDVITSVEISGSTYYLTANEGDAREYDALIEEVDVEDLILNSTNFTDPTLQDDENLGSLTTTVANGNNDGGTDFEEIFSFGARSFSIWDDTGSLVYDSGDQFEQITANRFPSDFNSDNDENDSFDSRSDNKGPEPEAITVGQINNKYYAFIGLERIGGIMVYDITDPTNPEFVAYENNRDFSVLDVENNLAAVGDLGPEDIKFIPASQSPTGGDLVLVANEVSGSVSAYSVTTPIDEARTLADGTMVTVEGIITRVNSDLAPTENQIARIQDDTGALAVFDFDGSDFAVAINNGDIRQGDLVSISGEVSLFNGLFELVSVSGFNVIDRNIPLPEPETVTLQEIATDLDSFESKLLLIKDITIDAAGDTEFQENKNYDLTDASEATGAVKLSTFPNETAIIGNSIPTTPFDFVGILSEFNGTPQLVAVNEKDIRANFKLQLLHASDLEAGIEAVGTADRSDVGDAARFSALVEYFRAEYPGQTLLLSSGDNYIPGPVFSAGGDDSLEPLLGDAGPGRADIAFMNAIGFNASALGNHEFDEGSDRVESILEPDGSYPGTLFPYLSVNLDFEGSSDLSSLAVEGGNSPQANSIAPSVVTELNGEKVGIIGVTTPELASISFPDAGIIISPADPLDLSALANIVQAEVDNLSSAGVNKIILVSHLQEFSNEEQLSALLSDVDIIIAGGSDRLLADSDDRLRAGDTAEDDYPLFRSDINGEDILIISSDSQYRYLGRLAVEFDEQGKIITESLNSAENGAFATDDQGVLDITGAANVGDVINSEVDVLAEAIAVLLEEKLSNTFGITEVFINGIREDVRTQETNMGNLTADANLFVARQFDSEVAASFKNGGGIRAPIGSVDSETGERLPPLAIPGIRNEGEVSQLDIENTLRFNNGLTIITIRADSLLAALENGVSRVENISGRFPQIAGIEFSFDPTLPPFERVQTAAIVDENSIVQDLFVENGQVIGDPSRTFKMVTLNFLVNIGGDDYTMFTDANTAAPSIALIDNLSLGDGNATFTSKGSEQDALAEYLLSEGPFTDADTPRNLDQRIQNLSEKEDDVATSNDELFSSLPEEFSLEQNFPNPFNPSTQIQYSLPQNASVKLTVYDVLGRQVAVLVNNEQQSAGSHSVTFDAGRFSSGMYLYRIEAGSFTDVRKMMLIK